MAVEMVAVVGMVVGVVEVVVVEAVMVRKSSGGPDCRGSGLLVIIWACSEAGKDRGIGRVVKSQLTCQRPPRGSAQ